MKKSYVDRLDARNLLEFSLFKTSFEFLMDQNRFLADLPYLITCFLKAIRQEVNNLESSVVVKELECAKNRALYGLL